MKKMVYCIIAAVVVLACICILIVRGLSMNNNNVLDGDGMINPMAIDSFTYRRGGGSLGADYALVLQGNSLSVEKCEGNGGKTYKKSFTVPPEVIENIMSIIYDSEMRLWGSDFERSDLFVLDGETTSVTVSFSDGRSVSFDSDLIIPEGGWDTVNEVVHLLENIADK